MIHIAAMDVSEIGRIREIDRTQRVTQHYVYVEGKLEVRDERWDIPRWSERGPRHSVEAYVAAWKALLDLGGTMLGAFDGERLVGVAIYRPHLAEDMAQLAVLHVSNGYRGQGVGTTLVGRVIELARADGHARLYVSSNPSRPTVDFYRARGFDLVERPHPELYALEL